ncbi:J domain-containing protein [Cystobacter ferrugineus]|uniref:Molecular chaperone DnaJ n=1 Tax=Cystobacter ferrugineus TaxID=83449 RepID=A0A1L9AYC9_9BACT|nr:J domain-containing protein [Cystobacter ferrugineus]OJH35027.1 molecular chaperone DnaJ [Cystobacter ferrugineus]
MSAAVGTSWNWRTLENVEVECTYCGVRMARHEGPRIKYFRCGSCHRWVSSTYTEVFRADAKMRTHPVKDKTDADARFLAAKNKLEAWLAALDEQDPHQVLGVSPTDPIEVVRARFRELALAQHPDRGGCEAKMRELNVAYEKILGHRQRARTPVRQPTSAPARGPALPARSR